MQMDRGWASIVVFEVRQRQKDVSLSKSGQARLREEGKVKREGGHRRSAAHVTVVDRRSPETTDTTPSFPKGPKTSFNV
ncbi:hypothetical protein Trydic_g11229 [Trypoxylus dichotomus]